MSSFSNQSKNITEHPLRVRPRMLKAGNKHRPQGVPVEGQLSTPQQGDE